MKKDWFAEQLLQWFDQHGRKNLPWQNPRSPYFVWLSEIMLQQTQVATVIGYFEKFVVRFPDVHALAQATLDEVLVYWAGLGYYSRARNLYKTAQIIVAQYSGIFPNDIESLTTLPGIGRSTAGAIVAQAFNQRAVILEGNVKRILSRYHAIDGVLNDPVTIKKLWSLAEQHTPNKRLVDYTQAIMDLGALVCTRTKPKCSACLLEKNCQAAQTNATLSFPVRALKKTIPERTRFFLLFINCKQEILLEQQPTPGIWAGLWSLPSALTLDECSIYSPKQWMKKILLPERVHRFTHFTLTIKPVLITDVSKIKLSADKTQQWVKFNELQSLGLPAPIKKILTGYRV